MAKKKLTSQLRSKVTGKGVAKSGVAKSGVAKSGAAKSSANKSSAAKSSTATRVIQSVDTLATNPNIVEIRVAGQTVARILRERAERLGLAAGIPWKPALAAQVDAMASQALAREAALGFLAKRAWSAAALEARLVKSGHSEPASRVAIAALVTDGWLDDRAYAAMRSAHHGKRGALAADALQALLESDGVEERVAQTVAAKSAATSKEIRQEARAAYKAGESMQRVAGRLARRGFDADTIQDALEYAGFRIDE